MYEKLLVVFRDLCKITVFPCILGDNVLCQLTKVFCNDLLIR